jgi:hypothetical protein
MGCDIHMYLEKKVNGKWVSADPITKVGDGLLDVDHRHRVYTGRNYLLFSVLAGVREPIPGLWQKYKVKGFPEDADPMIKKIYKRWGGDAHTASHLTLKELKEVDWNKTGVMLSFDVTERQKEIYEYFKNKASTGKPGELCLIDYFIYNTIKDPWFSVLETVMEPKRELKLTEIHVLVPLSFVFDDFDKVLWNLKDMTILGNLTEDEIRLVFWFDN